MYRCGNSTARTVAWTSAGIICVTLLELGVEWVVDKMSTYDLNGYDSNGYDKDGYDRNGFNSSGYDRKGYNLQGYNKCGYDAEGYDVQGYNAKGFARNGFNADGFDTNRFDQDGRDQEGFNRAGYDAEGFHRNGYNRNGFNREGYDWQGYGRDGYNVSGIDRYGNNRQYYTQYIAKLFTIKEKAFKQMKDGEFVYALLDARMILEEVINLVVGHSIGEKGIGDNLLENLKICEKKNLLKEDEDYMNRLHGVRKLCNPNMHSISNTESLTYNQVYFAIMQIKDLLTVAENVLIY